MGLTAMVSVLKRDRRGEGTGAEEGPWGLRGREGVPQPQGMSTAPKSGRGKGAPESLLTECGPKDTLISDF